MMAVMRELARAPEMTQAVRILSFVPQPLEERRVP